MHVLILLGSVLFLIYFSISQPAAGKTFSPFRLKFNMACRFAMLALGVVAVLYMVFGSYFASRCEAYDIDTDVYAIEMKTDGHRLFGFLTKTQSMTIFGDEAREFMEAAFGKTSRGTMLSWNQMPAWAGKYTVRVFYTEEDYQRHLDGLSPINVERNSVEVGRMYRFYFNEDGRIYCSFGFPLKPIYRRTMPWKLRFKYFPL